LLGIATLFSVYYYFYEGGREVMLKLRHTPGKKALSTIESIILGLIAGSATSIISNPVWVIQTAQTVRTMSSMSASSSTDKGEQAPQIKKLGFFETFQSIIQKDGITGFWRGIGPALVLVVNPVLQYTVFEQLKNMLVQRRTLRLRAGGNRSAVAVLTDMDFFFLGALSKLIATSTTYPYIVVKSRLQAGQEQAKEYKSSLDGLLTIVNNEGIEGLYKGLSGKLMQSVLTAAILFAMQRRIYEMTKKAITAVRIP